MYIGSDQHKENLKDARVKSQETYIGSDRHKENLKKARLVAQKKKSPCRHCGRKIMPGNHLRKHEEACDQNPANQIPCPVCETMFKPKPRGGGKGGYSITCSRACANTHFRSGESNGNWKANTYRTTCFLHHKKECVVCGENKIVEVHHLDENKENNEPDNLIPLCPTHHQYWHSRYRDEVEPVVRKYLNDWSGGVESNHRPDRPKRPALPC